MQITKGDDVICLVSHLSQRTIQKKAHQITKHVVLLVEDISMNEADRVFFLHVNASTNNINI